MTRLANVFDSQLQRFGLLVTAAAGLLADGTAEFARGHG
jgi:hypothetical protein